MHTHLDDGDWKAARQRHKASTAVPKAFTIPLLSKLRDEIDISHHSPSTPGPSFKRVIEGASIPDSILDSNHKAVLSSYRDAHDLLNGIKQHRYSVELVIESHLRIAALAQQALGCYSEIFFDQARIRARQIDDEIKSGKQMGKLAGLPISVKAHIAVGNTGSDRGFIFDILDPRTAKRLLDEEEASGSKAIPKSTLRLLRIQGNHIQETDGVIAKALLAEGAIIIAKTVMPQSVMQLDTCSNLHGQTLNPLNMYLSPGGSSGGESASIASGATVFGIGTDIGGSVRQPASVTGLYGIRCTVGRIASGGTRSTMLGNLGIEGLAGPLSLSMRDLRLVTQILVQNTSHCDPFLVPPVPFQPEPILPTKIRVGIMVHDDHVLPITPIRRAMQYAIDKLDKHDSIELILCPPCKLYEKGWSLARELYFMENGSLIKALASITGEPLLPLTQFILSDPVKDHTASECWELQYARESFKRQYWQEVWIQNNLDVLLCPAAHMCAPRFNSIKYWNYTSFFNLLDLPGVVLPIKAVLADSKIDIEFEGSEGHKNASPFSQVDMEVRAEYAEYRQVFDGAPIGLQIIGKRFKEDLLLSVSQLVDDIINMI